jgi:hypothetical protein
MSVTRFPVHRSAAVWLIREPLGGFYVIAGQFGWLFGSHREAPSEAQRIAAALQFNLREVAQ